MKDNPPLAVQAAKASWMAPGIAILLGIAGNSAVSGPTVDVDTARTARVVIGGIAVLIVLFGLVCGALALFGLPKHGPKGILLPALIGIVLSSGYLYLVLATVIALRQIIQQGQGPPQ